MNKHPSLRFFLRKTAHGHETQFCSRNYLDQVTRYSVYWGATFRWENRDAHAVTRRVTVTVTCWYCVTCNTSMLIRKKGLLLKLWINRNKRVRKLISKPIDLFSSFDRETTSINNQYILKKNRKRSNGRTVEWLNRGISLNAECFVVWDKNRARMYLQ